MGGRARGLRRATVTTVALVFVLVLVAAACAPRPGLGPRDARPYVPIGQQGRWFVDGSGRVVLFHGVNFVEKWAPYTPAAAGFDDDDAALLVTNGFNAVRLGVAMEFLMPDPGRIDRTYLESIASTTRLLGRHGIYVLLDFHQDGYGPAVHGNGMPAWSTITDGLPNPDVPFPLYYLQNPALQRAFDNFWANRAGPDGVPLQTHYATAMRTVAQRVVRDDNVIGYEAMNEPWPGTNWQPCLTGCPDAERDQLGEFGERMAAAVRTVDRKRPVFVEPWVLFNYGRTDTVLPGAGSGNALATHVYAASPTEDASVMDRSVAAADRDGAAVIVTEFEATNDPATIERYAQQLDDHLLPWLFWSYSENVVHDSTKPLVAPNVDMGSLTALSRPYPQVVDGTPTAMHFEPATAAFDLSFGTTRPDGRRGTGLLESSVVVPPLRYPTGYTATVSGAVVTSRPCASTLTVRNRPGASTVTVHLAPAPAGTCR